MPEFINPITIKTNFYRFGFAVYKPRAEREIQRIAFPTIGAYHKAASK